MCAFNLSAGIEKLWQVAIDSIERKLVVVVAVVGIVVAVHLGLCYADG